MSPNISAGYLKNTPEFNHVFVLYGPKNMDKQRYHDLYGNYDFTNYVFCHSIVQLIRLLVPYRKKAVLFHAGSYLWMLVAIFMGCKNINWVCWGNGANLGVSFIGRHITWLKRFIYNQFHTIDTLMTQDKESIAKYYNVPSDRIQVIPYMGAFSEEHADLYVNLRKQHTFAECGKPIVLLGNNPGNISNYIELIHRLAPYKGAIKVQCMLHYSLVKDALYERLIKTGTELFGDDFRSNEEFYEFNDYLAYMNKCDIYICGGKAQTGLGAINTCLRLGKKIYITGKNYEWITERYKAFVFQSDDINENMDVSTFMEDLSEEIKEYNVNCMTKNRPDNPGILWGKYLESV